MYNKTRKKKSNMSSHIRVEARVREVRRCVFVSHYYVKNRKKKRKEKNWGRRKAIFVLYIFLRVSTLNNFVIY